MNFSPNFWLSANNHCTFNRDVARALNINAAVLLAELASRFHHHRGNKELTQEGFFPYSIETVEKITCLSREEQDHAIRLLEQHGMIIKKVMGLPAKRHFKINEDVILDFFSIKNSSNHSSV